MSHETKTFGLPAAEAGVARKHAFTRKEEFNEQFVFSDIDEDVRTRLGDDGPRIQLAESVPGPFGTPVRTFNLPAHIFRNGMPTKEDVQNVRAEPREGRLTLYIGNNSLEYDRRGLRS